MAVVLIPSLDVICACLSFSDEATNCRILYVLGIRKIYQEFRGVALMVEYLGIHSTIIIKINKRITSLFCLSLLPVYFIR
jgi:hypothetical protein